MKILIILLFLMISQNAFGQTFPIQIDGRIGKFWVVQNDVIVELDASGPCGSIYYRVLRSAANFQEMVAVLLTAAGSGKPVRLELSQCSGNENIVSHGAAVFF